MTHSRTTYPINNRMPMHQGPGTGYSMFVDTPERGNVILYREIGEVLRGVRQRQGRTLCEVSSQARVSLGYLSEAGHGQKEASSELLASICQALDVPLSMVLCEVFDRIALIEDAMIPDTVSDGFVHRQGVTLR